MSKIIITLLLGLITTVGVVHTTPADYRLYTDQELREARQVYRPNVEGMLFRDLIRQLPAKMRQKLSNVRLSMPLRGRHPLQYSARPLDQRVIVPVSSLKFLDELTIVWAWLEEKGCRSEYITSYLTSLLRFREIGKGPLEAFQLTQDITKDSRVNSLSLKLSKTAIYFLLAHEVGHLYHNHNTFSRGVASQLEEQEADEFALSTMARIGVMPAGMVHYFIAGYMFDPLPDLTTWELEEQVIAELTHPLTSERIRLISDRLIASPLDYSHSEDDPHKAAQNVTYVAQQMAGIADHMDHGGVRLYSAGWLMQHFPATEFTTACPIR